MKLGIITFHAVYNYGAVLQAYSLQKIFSDMNIDSEIIDFRQPSQIDYTSLYTKRKGIKSIIKNCMILPKHAKRKKRAEKFDNFIENELVKSNIIYTNEAELNKTNGIYDIFFTGSDQVWNTKKKRDYSSAYFLDFVDSSNPNRYAYAASIGTSEKEDLTEQISMLKKYKKISCREKRGVDVVSAITGQDIELVLDPTLLVDIKHLNKYVNKSFSNEPYLFYYSLDGFDKRKNNLDLIYSLAHKFNLNVKIITPEWVYTGQHGEQYISAGIEDFLTLIANAELVCTNSFHGTALSVKFNRNFYVLEKYDGKDDRKKTILEEFDLTDRCIYNIKDIEDISDYHINYDVIKDRIDESKQKSLSFLRQCISDSNDVMCNREA